jgi:DNA-binding NarL/FixJ family response regulator
MNPIKVAIFEDNVQRRELLEMLLNNSDGLCCVGAFENCSHLIKQLSECMPDVVLMDIDMPKVNGIEGLKLIRQYFGGMKVLMQTIFEEEEKIFDAIVEGADGYILKKADTEKLIDAIHDVIQGGAPMTPTVARQVLLLFSHKHQKYTRKDFQLTPKEIEILNYLVQGYSYKMIADKCHISFPTVNTHINHIYKKLQVNSGTEAVAKAIQNKLV